MPSLPSPLPGTPEPVVALEERTIAGTHEALWSLFQKRVSCNAEVVDLGAGSGAWLVRLQRAGYWRLFAVEQDTKRFQVDGIPCAALDLNHDFSGNWGRRFDAVCAIEVIEHLENPRHFLRHCHQLLKPGGWLFLTTPNIECTVGRLRFLFTGQFRQFEADPRYNDPTHISPLQSRLFKKAVAEAGFEIEYHGFNRAIPSGTRWPFRWLAALVTPFLSGTLGGDTHLFVLRRPSTANLSEVDGAD